MRSISLFTKLSLSFIFLIGAAGCIGFLLILNSVRDVIIKSQVENFHNQQSHRAHLLKEIFNQVNIDLELLTDLPQFSALVNSEVTGSEYPRILQDVTNVFYATVQAKPYYYQLRYINETGNEVIRIQYDNGSSKVIPSEQLQNKSLRYYFIDVMTTPKNKLYISPIDLNREGSRDDIEVPYKSVIRIATPVFSDNGTRKGFVIINVSGEYIRSFAKGSRFTTYFVNQDGSFILHPDPTKEWGGARDLATGISFSSEFPDLALQIANQKAGIIRDENTFYSFYKVATDETSNKYLFLIIDTMPTFHLMEPLNRVTYLIALIVIVIILCVVVAVYLILRQFLRPLKELTLAAKQLSEGNYDIAPPVDSHDEFALLSREFSQMAEKIKHHHHDLEATINERTQELREKNLQLYHDQKELSLIKQAIDHALNFIYITDPQGIVIYANHALKNLSGFTPEDAVGKKAAVLWGGLMSREYYEDMWHTIKVEKKQFQRNILFKTKDDRRLLTQLTIDPILDKNGTIMYFMGEQKDVTKEEENKKRFGILEQQFKLAFTHSPIGNSLVSPEGKLMQVNQALCKITGYTDLELQQKNYKDITHPDDRQADIKRHQELLDGKQESYQTEKRYLHKDGHFIWIQLSVSLVRDYENKPLYFVSQIQDITERKHHEEQNREIEAMRSNFVTVMAHQLRTPMTAIRWNLESFLTSEGPLLTSERKGIIESMLDSINQVTKRLGELLDVENVASGQTYVYKEPVDFIQIIDSVYILNKKKFEDKTITIQIHYPHTPLPTLHIDREKIIRVLNVLIENALLYSSENNRVDIYIENNGKTMRFSIKDNGIGIPEIDKSRVFSRYFRASNSFLFAPNQSGTGLYIAKRYIEILGGTMGFESGEGKGSTFWFELPL